MRTILIVLSVSVRMIYLPVHQAPAAMRSVTQNLPVQVTAKMIPMSVLHQEVFPAALNHSGQAVMTTTCALLLMFVAVQVPVQEQK